MDYKRRLVNLLYKLKYVNKKVRFEKGAEIADSSTSFEGGNRIGRQSRFRGTMGYGSYIGQSSRLHATVGRYTCISDRVYTASGTHPAKNFVSIHPAFFSTARQAGFTYAQVDCFQERLVNPVDGKTAVFIGNDVWIGCDVTIIGGIKIGDGAIIAAGAVVTQDVEPYTIVGGVPAKPIRKRFSEEQIAFLQAFRWWDKDPKWLKENCADMQNIEVFMKKHAH